MVQSMNENHLTTFNDLAVLSDSETSSSTSCKRIIGIEQCDHCLRPVRKWSINQDIIMRATWFVSCTGTIPRYRILGSGPVPNYRKFLKGMGNKANLTKFSRTTYSTREIEHIGVFKLVQRTLTRAGSCMLPVCQGPIGNIIIRSDDTDVLLLSVYYFSRGQLTDHLYMLKILEWSVTFQDISLQTKLAHQFV